MDSLGQTLKKERERQGVSLKEIAESTKINFRFLEALEEDRYELLPGKFFTRGIIRTYANFLDLDEGLLLSQLPGEAPSEASSEAPSRAPQAEAEKKPPKHEDPLQSPRRILSYSVIAVLLTVVLIIFFLQVQKKTPENLPPSPESVAAFVQEERSLPTPEPKAQERELRLELRFVQETWIQVSADGELRLDGIKKAGETSQVVARESLELYTGNAGGFSFTLNGQEGRTLGPPGSVARDVLITLDNYRDFLEKQ